MSKQPPLGELLRYYRQQRGRSQMDVALDAQVSQRHISFVESGRSVPSRELLLALAEVLDVPLRERNGLLLAAGYAPMYGERSWDAPEMAAVSRAVDRMLQQHEPHPALVLDRHWYVRRTNAAAPQFFGQFLDLASKPKPRNLLELMFDPEGFRPFVVNWEEVAAGLMQRVRREAVGHLLEAETRALLEGLQRFPGVERLGRVQPNLSPVIPIHFAKGRQRWSYFSLVTTVGTPQCATVQEMRVECMFPLEGA